jgi:ribosome-associated protein
VATATILVSPGIDHGWERVWSRVMAREIAIRGDTIRLGQLLKLAGAVGGGGELKQFLATATVLVNGRPDARRGRQLHPGDVVSVGDEELLIVHG